jgi:hypothetical protein
MTIMEQQQLKESVFNGKWVNSKLLAVLAGDVAAAGISATLISPLITAIDRSVYVYLLSNFVINITVGR